MSSTTVQTIQRIGLFGGTFDPIHNGHLQIIQHAIGAHESLDRLIVIPCRRSPHKLPNSGAPSPAEDHHRWEMLQLALAAQKNTSSTHTHWEKVELSRFELDGPSTSYAYHTFDHFQKEYPTARLVLLIGLDQLVALPDWIQFDQWKNKIDYLVFNRGSNSLTEIPQQTKELNLSFIEENISDLSSSEIRTNIKNGRAISHMTPQEVETHIIKNHLYTTSQAKNP